MPIGIGLAIAGIAGAGASLFGASSQVSAEQSAIAAQQQMFQEGLATQKNDLTSANSLLSPFISQGQSGLNWYNYLTGASSVVPGAEGASQTLGMPGAPGGSQSSGAGGPVGTPTPATTVTGPSGQPVNIGGNNTFNPLNAPLTAPFTAGSLPYTPGYQFTLNQGLKGVQNSYAAQGLGSSGAAMKGAADYATGQASNTYNQQFANYLTQNQQIANMLLAGGQLGAGAAETMASLYGSAGNAALGGAVTTGQGIASSTAGIGNALAGGAAGVANSLGGSLLQYALLSKLMGGGGTTPGTVGPSNQYVNNALLTGGGYPYASGPYQTAFPTG